MSGDLPGHAFHGNQYVAGISGEKVTALATKLGYRPNPETGVDDWINPQSGEILTTEQIIKASGVHIVSLPTGQALIDALGEKLVDAEEKMKSELNFVLSQDVDSALRQHQEMASRDVPGFKEAIGRVRAAYDEHQRALIENDTTYYDEQRVFFADAWKAGSATSEANAMKVAANNEFGLIGEVYDPEDAGSGGPYMQARARAVVRRMYTETQAEFARPIEERTPVAGWNGREFVLYRGVQKKYALHGALESWTAEKEIALKFAGYSKVAASGQSRPKRHNILEQRVPRSRILTHFRSKTWRSKGTDALNTREQEFIVLSGSPTR